MTEQTLKKTLTMAMFFILWEHAGANSKVYIVTKDDLQEKENTAKPLSESDGFINQMQHLLSANVQGYAEKSLDEIERIVDKRIQKYSNALRESRSSSSIPKYPKKRRSALSNLVRNQKRKKEVRQTLNLKLK